MDLLMKKERVWIGIVLFCMLSVSVQVEACGDKERREARREAWRLSRDGWKAFPDAQSLTDQLEQTNAVHFYPSDGQSLKYIIGEAVSSVCPSLEEAEAQANAMARIDLLQQCEMEVTALWSNTALMNDEVMEAHVDNASMDVIASKGSFFGFLTKNTVVYDNVSKASLASTELYYNDELLMRNTSTESDAESEINWEAVIKYGEVVPYAQNAWRITRMYRKVGKGYEALVRVCNYAPKETKK